MLSFCKAHHPCAHDLEPHTLRDDIPVSVLMGMGIGIGVGVGVGVGVGIVMGVKREEE